MSKQFDCHHCIPTSRNARLKKESWNRRYMKRTIHAAWHIITGNRLPIEGLIHVFKIFCPKEALALEPEAVRELKRLLDGGTYGN